MDIQNIWRQASEYFRNGQYTEAIDCYTSLIEQVLQLNAKTMPLIADLYKVLGICHQQ